mmetsp:Transcript_137550/g.325786  ORF Transcript_137550/g.325786 Transcript_137550/m.325786 type:complete len:274 (-) Transcript_137550:251-1072(-)
MRRACPPVPRCLAAVTCRCPRSRRSLGAQGTLPQSPCGNRWNVRQRCPHSPCKDRSRRADIHRELCPWKIRIHTRCISILPQASQRPSSHDPLDTLSAALEALTLHLERLGWLPPSPHGSLEPWSTPALLFRPARVEIRPLQLVLLHLFSLPLQLGPREALELSLIRRRLCEAPPLLEPSPGARGPHCVPESPASYSAAGRQWRPPLSVQRTKGEYGLDRPGGPRRRRGRPPASKGWHHANQHVPRSAAQSAAWHYKCPPQPCGQAKAHMSAA